MGLRTISDRCWLPPSTRVHTQQVVGAFSLRLICRAWKWCPGDLRHALMAICPHELSIDLSYLCLWLQNLIYRLCLFITFYVHKLSCASVADNNCNQNSFDSDMRSWGCDVLQFWICQHRAWCTKNWCQLCLIEALDYEFSPRPWPLLNPGPGNKTQPCEHCPL